MRVYAEAPSKDGAEADWGCPPDVLRKGEARYG